MGLLHDCSQNVGWWRSQVLTGERSASKFTHVDVEKIQFLIWNLHWDLSSLLAMAGGHPQSITTWVCLFMGTACNIGSWFHYTKQTRSNRESMQGRWKSKSFLTKPGHGLPSLLPYSVETSYKAQVTFKRRGWHKDVGTRRLASPAADSVAADDTEVMMLPQAFRRVVNLKSQHGLVYIIPIVFSSTIQMLPN